MHRKDPCSGVARARGDRRRGGRPTRWLAPPSFSCAPQLCSSSFSCAPSAVRAGCAARERRGGGAAAARRRPLAELLCGGGGGPCHSPTAAPVAQWRRCAHRRAAGCTGRTTGNHRPGMEPVREIEKRFSEVRAAPAAFTRASPVLTDCVLPVHCLGLCAVRGAADTADGLR